MSMDIPLLISRSGKKNISEKETYKSGGRTLTRQVNRSFNYTYDNYIFGKKASEITDASDCSIIRGSIFGGRNSKVEVNHGYTITDAVIDSKKISEDSKN